MRQWKDQKDKIALKSFSIEYVKEETNALTIKTAIVNTIIAAVAPLLFYFCAQGIVKPLHQVQSNLGTLTEGDLTSSIEAKREDEVGVMMGFFNKLSGRLRDVMGSVKNSTDTLASLE